MDIYPKLHLQKQYTKSVLVLQDLFGGCDRPGSPPSPCSNQRKPGGDEWEVIDVSRLTYLVGGQLVTGLLEEDTGLSLRMHVLSQGYLSYTSLWFNNLAGVTALCDCGLLTISNFESGLLI